MNKGPQSTELVARRVSGESIIYVFLVLTLSSASVSDGDRTLCPVYIGLTQYYHPYVRIIPLYAGWKSKRNTLYRMDDYGLLWNHKQTSPALPSPILQGMNY